MSWRLIRFEKRSAALNMAIDEAIAEGVANGTSPPTVRFYGWAPSAVSIGRFQAIRDEVDLEQCRAHGVDVVRRRTGGGAVFHDEMGEVTYSVIAPEPMLPKDIGASYRLICGWIVSGLHQLGVESEFAPINDVVVGGKKISGSAQTRWSGVVLQHGTLLLKLDLDRMFVLLRVPDSKTRTKGIASARERVTSLDRHSNAGIDKVLAALESAFCGDLVHEVGTLSAEELNAARRKAVERYRADSWTFER